MNPHNRRKPYGYASPRREAWFIIERRKARQHKRPTKPKGLIMKSEQLEQLYENTIIRMLELLGDASAADALYVVGELASTIIEGASDTKLEQISIANKFCQCLIASIMDVDPDTIQTLTLFDAPPGVTKQ